MKRKHIMFTILSVVLVGGMLQQYAAAKKTTNAVNTLHVTHEAKRPSFQGGSKTFTGKAKIDMLFLPNAHRHASAANVTFQPGARTAWHSHPAGQTLVVTSGTGWVQRWGKAKKVIKVGDVVWIPPNTKHWHGATQKTSMTHTAIQEQRKGKVVTWMELVSDLQYTGVKKKK